jgi:hypothetical protein
MSNYVEIANLTATLIGGQARIVSPDDNRVLARTIKAVWDMQRRATIRDGEWNFACQRAGLPALAQVPPYPFGYVYALPSEALKFIELIDDPRDDYRLEGRQILSNSAPPLNIRYCVDVPAPEDWDEMFADAFAKRVAWTIGKRIAGSAYNEINGETIYLKAIADAKASDGRENPPLDQEESDWIIARWGDYSIPGLG